MSEDRLPDTFEPLVEFLTQEIDLAKYPAVTADQLARLQKKYDVLAIRRGDPGDMAPLIAAVLAGQARRVQPKDADTWLLVREALPADGMALDALVRDQPDTLPVVMLHALQGFAEFHDRGVVLNEGARASLQILRPGPSPSLLVGWHTEWATVSDGKGNVIGGKGACDALSTDASCPQYPARDLLWFLSDLPASAPLGPAADLMIVFSRRDLTLSGKRCSVFAVMPLGMLRGLNLGDDWPAYATPIGSTNVALTSDAPLVDDAWAVQKIGAAAAAPACQWTLDDMKAALQELDVAGLSGGWAVMRVLGQQRVIVTPDDSSFSEEMLAAMVPDPEEWKRVRVRTPEHTSPSTEAPQEDSSIAGPMNPDQPRRSLLALLGVPDTRQDSDLDVDLDEPGPVEGDDDGQLRSVLELYGALDLHEERELGSEDQERELSATDVDTP
jgi:hypothetical protein